MPLVLAFGDSLTAGYGLARDQSYPARLGGLLAASRPGSTVVNAGISGDTSADALARLPAVLARLPRPADLAVVEIGANDVIRRVPPAATRAAIGGILAAFTRAGTPVLLGTIDVPAPLAAHAAGFHGLLDAVAAEHGAATCPFFPPGVLGRSDMVLADGFHPNARAMALIAAHLLPYVEAMLSN